MSIEKDKDCSDIFNKHIKVDGFVQSFESNSEVSFLSKFKKLVKMAIKPYIPDFFYVKNMSLADLVDFNYYDLIISSSEPKGLHKLIEKNVSYYGEREFKYLQYWGDPWFDDISRPTNFITKILEQRLICKADYLVYNSKLTLKRQKNLFKNESSKMFYLPRGLDLSQAEIPIKICTLTNNIRILYAGDYRSDYRSIQALINACSELKVNLAIAGNGDYERANIDSCVKEFGRISTVELNKLRSCIDVEVVIMNSSGGQLPGKVFDVMLSDRVVILVLDGEFSVSDIPCSNRFIVVNNNQRDIQDALQSIMDIDFKFKFNFDDLNFFSIDNILVELIKDVKSK
nr:hypothetical protein BCU57_18880 [Shewanella sp. 10N.286.48.B5]